MAHFRLTRSQRRRRIGRIHRRRWLWGKRAKANRVRYKLIGQIPQVTADWQWSGEWPVTADALLSGAWSLPDENRLVLMFVSVSDQYLTAVCEFDAGRYDLRGGTFTLEELTAANNGGRDTVSDSFRRDHALPGRTARVWELRGR